MSKDFPGAFNRSRRAKRLTQKAAAADLGVTQPVISKWERGIDKPERASYRRVAKFMDVTEAQLEAMLETPPDRIVEIAKELHRLVDELVTAAAAGNF